MMAPMLQQRGDAWVGVTERTSAGEALKAADPTRYADVNVPSNDVAWDVLAQVGAAVPQGRTARVRCRASIPSTSTWPATRRAASTPPASRSGLAQALRHAGGQAGVRRVLPGRAGRERHAAARRAPRCSPSSSTPVWPAVGVPVVNLEDRVRRPEGFTAELPADRPGHARAEGLHQRVLGDRRGAPTRIEQG